MNKIFTAAVLGCGNIGSAVALQIARDASLIESRSGVRISLKYLVDVDFTFARKTGADPGLFETDFDKVTADPEVDCVIELIGGVTVAREKTRQALERKKHVVTANKALLAHHGAELLALARQNGVTLAFEGSCGGGIPIVKTLLDGLIANRIDALYGIVNGTCNYILSSMIRRGMKYEDALKKAQQKGLAEPDPALDVSGLDSAHKLAILSALAFGRQVDFDAIEVEGIADLNVMDVKFGQELGYIIKLLAIARRCDNGISLRVRPAFIHKEHPLAWVSGSFNSISVYGHAVGHTMYYGRGAGGKPTSSAVISDIVSIAAGVYPCLFQKLKIWPDLGEAVDLLPSSRIESRYYIRAMVVDRPGVFAAIATILGAQGISITSALQHESPETESHFVPVVITTHTALEGNVRKAIAEMKKLDVVNDVVCIDIVDEHEENL